MDRSLVDLMPFAQRLGIDLLSTEKDKIVAQVVVSEELCTTGHIMHGGAMMAFADTLGAIGAFMNLPEGKSGTTTIESKTNFLGSAKEGTVIRAECRPIHVGRRTSVWQTRLAGDGDKPIALITQTQLVL
ncbi:MAG: PaaI family thioesterase [Pseudomonadales bacterium]